MLRIPKIDKIDVLLVLVLFLQLGFRTNTGYDDQLSLVLTLGISLYFASRNFFVFSATSNLVKLVVWFSFFVFLCVASLAWSTGNNYGQLIGYVKETYIPALLTIFCISNYIKLNPHKIDRLLDLLIYAEILTLVRALLNTPFVALISSFNSRLYAMNLGVNYNYYTTQMAFVAAITFYLVCNKKSRRYWLSFAFIMANIVISGSRKAILVTAVAMLLVYVLQGNSKNVVRKIKRLFVILLLLLVALFIVVKVDFLYALVGEKLFLAIDSIGQNAEDISSNDVIDHSAHARAVLRDAAFSVFTENPLKGVGFYCFQFRNIYGLYAHNNYLEILADLGIIGFIVYYSYYIAILMKIAYNKFPYGKLLFIYVICQMILEWGHVTFLRLYCLIPLFVVAIVTFETKKDCEGLA